jgi:hypothetical protein
MISYFIEKKAANEILISKRDEVNEQCTRVYPEVPGLSHNEINNNNNNKHPLRSNIKGYGGKTH